MFVLYKGLVCLRHTGGATEGVILPRTPKGGAFALSLLDVSLATPHTTADGQTPRRPYFMWFSAEEIDRPQPVSSLPS